MKLQKEDKCLVKKEVKIMANSKLVKANEKIAESVTSGFKK